ncbi:MAG: hypothetical protein WCK42_02715 [Myxococcaceae bacterium]
MNTLEQIKKLKIAWCPWSQDPFFAANLRRFTVFASRMNIAYESYDSTKEYDVIIVNQLCDLTRWSRFQKSDTKLVFEMVDSYLQTDFFELKAYLRGFAKFIFKQHRSLDWNYGNLIRRMMNRANVVVCSTPEQKQAYSVYNSSIFDILDFNNQQIQNSKQDYKIGDVAHLAWEGMGGNAWAFQEIAPVLKKIHKKQPLALHLVTDLKYKSYNGPFAWEYQVKSQLQKILGEVPVYLYDWNPVMLSTICTRCDIALLPVPQKPPIYWAKPENRLLMLWRMGLPVLASANPAFARCMKAAGNHQACENLNDWEEKLSSLIESETLRRESAERGRAYADEQVNESVLSEKWTRVLESVL